MKATPMLAALRYLSEKGEQQTFRIAREGIKCPTDTARAALQTLQRRGLVIGRKRWTTGPFFWSLTDNGRRLVDEVPKP